MSLRDDAAYIYNQAIMRARPDEAVRSILRTLVPCEGKTVVVSVGKAAWDMAKAAHDVLKETVFRGVVVTKYGHSRGKLSDYTIIEAAHPVPDENAFRAAEAVMEAVRGLSERDRVLFLVSGGGSALFESSPLSPQELQAINRTLLAGGESITSINTVRKHLSYVKGGRFAGLCAPAKVINILLSDVIGSDPATIASGPAYPDHTTIQDACAVLERNGITLSPQAAALFAEETPKTLDNIETHICGSVALLCKAAKEACEVLGYRTVLLTDELACEACEAGRFLGAVARTYANADEKTAFIAGGETVVKVTGKGLGGRNQELALAAAPYLAGLANTAVFSVGSDGTDGPTDAAGGFADGNTAACFASGDKSIEDYLADNDAYHALMKSGGLIFTGPTGTNVNDIAVLLIQPHS